MAYRFSSPAPFAPRPAPAIGPGLGLTSAYLQAQQLQMQRAAQERAQMMAEEEARANQAAMEQARMAAIAAAQDRASKADMAERKYQLDLAKQRGTVESQARQLEMARDPEGAAALRRLGLPGGMVPSLGPAALAKTATSGEVPPGAPEPPEAYRREVKALQDTWLKAAEKESDPQKRAIRERAAAIAESVRGSSKSAEDAKDTLTAMVAKQDQEIGATRRAAMVGSGPGTVDHTPFNMGMNQAIKVYGKRIQEPAQSYESMKRAIDIIDSDPNNVAAISQAVFQVARALNGSRPTDKDVAAVFGFEDAKSLFEQGEAFIKNKILGMRDDPALMQQLRRALATSAGLSRDQLRKSLSDFDETTSTMSGYQPEMAAGFKTAGQMFASYRDMLEEDDKKNAKLIEKFKKRAAEAKSDPLGAEGWK